MSVHRFFLNKNKNSAEQSDENATEVGDKPEVEKPKLCCSSRLLFILLCLVAVFSVSYIRVSISMAFLCMVSLEPEGKPSNIHVVKKTGEFHWSSAVKGYLMSSIFYGFIVGPFISGFLSFRFGGKIVLVIGTLGSGATYFLQPEAARCNPYIFFGIRTVTGFFSSFVVPAFYDLVSHWIVPEERHMLVTAVLVGIPTAGILNFPITSFICWWLGWVWTFYVIGIWMTFWGVVYSFVIYKNPTLCPFISEKELNYLKNGIPNPGKIKIPWKAIIRSLPIYAYIVMHFCINYVYLSMMFSIPLVMAQLYHLPLQQNGLLSAIPFVGSFAMRILLSLFFERLRLKLKWSKNTIRKIFVFVGAVQSSSFFFIITLLSHEYWILGCFVLASTGLELCLTGGYMLSHMDLCPSYVNIISGIANTIGNCAGLISSVINGFITTNGTKEEWNAVFYVNIGILMGAMVFYLAFGQNRLQPWGLATSAPQQPTPQRDVEN